MRKTDAFDDLTDAELSLVTAFARAVKAERDHTTPDLKTLAENIDDVAKAGRLGDIFDKIRHAASQPPTRAPRLWDPDSDERPAIAVLDIYGYWLERGQMHTGTIHSLDKRLYRQFIQRKMVLNKDLLEMKAYETLEKKLPSKEGYYNQLLANWDQLDKYQRSELSAMKSMRNRKHKID